MPDARVIVVGGGPAGSATAFFLARAGIDVLVLDRATFPRDKPCSEYLSPQASRILHEMGALNAVENAGAAQLRGMRVIAPDGATLEGRFAAAHGYHGFRDRGLAVRRTVLDDLLLRRARDAGARLLEATRVVDVTRDSAGRVSGVATPEAAYSADLVIGADGLRSVVGRRLGLIRTSRWPRRLALVTHYRGVQGSAEFGEMHVDRDGYLGIAGVGSDLYNVALVVPVSKAADVAAGRTEFLESWIAERPRIAERFRSAGRVDSVRATGPFASAARHAFAPGAALVGDAADFFDPFTGEGIYAALRGGEMLAGFAAEALEQPHNGVADDRALAAYDRERRREFGGKWMVERLVGAAVAFPMLINRAAAVLAARHDMADLLVGVVGDFVPAREVLRPGYLLRLMLPIPARQ